MLTTLFDMALISWEKEAKRLIEQEERIEEMKKSLTDLQIAVEDWLSNTTMMREEFFNIAPY